MSFHCRLVFKPLVVIARIPFPGHSVNRYGGEGDAETHKLVGALLARA
jgi:hypothetical protein